MNRHLAILLGVTLAVDFAVSAEATHDKVERKTVTLINATGTADGSSEISREAVKECIVALPSAEAIEPEVTSDSRYLKEINGDPNKNDWAKTYTAHLVINYQVYKKDLLIVATKSVEGKEPTMREVEKRLPESKEFVSNPSDGDTYAGRSNRQYYYTKPEAAAKDVKERAGVWLKQQKPLLCADMK
ncbi:MAG: hypothetical protein JF616_09570 [Fibrobacteres bacterium]|nr:hypothetical protein [Fibrobacterota bacterium]